MVYFYEKTPDWPIVLVEQAVFYFISLICCCHSMRLEKLKVNISLWLNWMWINLWKLQKIGNNYIRRFKKEFLDKSKIRKNLNQKRHFLRDTRDSRQNVSQSGLCFIVIFCNLNVWMHSKDETPLYLPRIPKYMGLSSVFFAANMTKRILRISESKAFARSTIKKQNGFKLHFP